MSSDNFSTASLQRFISDPENQGASVVVRDPSVNRDGVSNNPVNSRVCALIEQGLMKKNYNPRDRRLFENAVAKLEDGSDYPVIRKITGTDLIFEVTQFSAVGYEVNEYFDESNRKHPFRIVKSKKEILTPGYILIGFSIEIKVILLADNLIAGIFRYNQVPCIDNCTVKNFTETGLSYIDALTAKTVTAKEVSLHENISFDRYDKQISDFITNFVIPNMFMQMAGYAVANIGEIPMSRQTKTGHVTGDEAMNIAETEQQLDQFVEDGQIAENRTEATERRKSGQDCPCEVQAEDVIQNLRPQDIQKREKEILKNRKKSGGVVTDSRAAALNSFCPDGWRAPTFAELKCMYRDKDKTGGFGNGGNYYSSKFSRFGSAGIDFDSGKEITVSGSRTANLRCVRCQQDKGFEGNANPESGSQMVVRDPVNEKERELALSSLNSYEIAGSVSNLIFDAIKDSKKSGKYKNDEERFANLKDRGQIANYIVSITTAVADFPDENSDKITFYSKKDEGRETALLLFLDGKCMGIGTKNKGLLTKIPAAQFTGMHTVSLWNSEKELLNIPVDFSFKTYYPFEWNRNTLVLATATATATANTSGEANAAVSSTNSYDVSGSVSDLILRAITEQEPKKHNRYKTDEERFNGLKNKKQITDYIGSVTANAVLSKEDSETAVFFCEGATGHDLNVLLFLDGRCIGAGTKNRGMFTKIPKVDGIHTFSLWCDDRKVLDLPVNFSFKSYYLFEWKRNNISLKN
jgi:hypothetical protein